MLEVAQELLPFSRPFLLEIQSEILSHLAVPDLKSCALVGRPWSNEANRLLWRFVRLELLISDFSDLPSASEKFGTFINTLISHPEHAANIRRLALKIDGFVHDEETLSILDSSTAFLRVPWNSIMRVLTSMSQLQCLRLGGRLLPYRLVSSICQALPEAPISAISTFAPLINLPVMCTTWATSIRDILLWVIGDCPELPPLPNLRFIASNNIEVVSKFVMSSPIESVYLFETQSRSYSTLGDAIRARVCAGTSTLRSIYLSLSAYTGAIVPYVIRLLQCPTLEHIHIVLDCFFLDGSSPLADYPSVCLAEGASFISQGLPTLKSLRFELYDEGLDRVPSKTVDRKQNPSHLESEAGLSLLTRLSQSNYPPLLEKIEIYSMGKSPSLETSDRYRTVSVEASRIVSESGNGLGVSDVWAVKDSVEDIDLQYNETVRAVGMIYPRWGFHNGCSIPAVPDADGIIRWSQSPSYIIEDLD
ncbi:hypothetical protein DL93DRAFT_2102431 [Clavulina sp. PMI_390]|nr:hypothetical protein DL93DRAFT_2102431 [Clavulina sp. PMI_390]